ncbi:hypothetical protein LJK88_19200 [Paenibacillus sp. P26]|nr:hypothetical protein LJK88_19200 [Paenibacillus sp. P26]UUZ96178.1 hypothetical protein LJK87_18625 [Paenibacillus sp. P25]
MNAAGDRKLLLYVYAVLIAITCFLAVPVEYYSAPNSPFPEDHGYQPIWVYKKEVSYRTPDGKYSGTFYTVKVDTDRVWIQIFGLTALFGAAFRLLGTEREKGKKTGTG